MKRQTKVIETTILTEEDLTKMNLEKLVALSPDFFIYRRNKEHYILQYRKEIKEYTLLGAYFK